MNAGKLICLGVKNIVNLTGLCSAVLKLLQARFAFKVILLRVVKKLFVSKDLRGNEDLKCSCFANFSD